MKTDNENRRGSKRSLLRNGEQGFTLLETAIAFVIMLVVGLAATSLFLYANSYNSGATDRALAIAVARQQMEQLRNASFTDSTLDVTATSGTSSTLTNGGKSFTVVKIITALSTCTGCTAARQITIRVTPQDTNPKFGANPVELITVRAPLAAGPYVK